MRESLGVWLKDRWRYERALRGPADRFLALCNRHEVLEPAPQDCGYNCCWAFTSHLHAPTVLPSLGQRLLQRCLEYAPIAQRSDPPAFSTAPQVSVLIGHRGLERLPLLLATLESLAGQRQVSFECLVIEHSDHGGIRGQLPGWVRHHHCRVPPGTPYNRSQTFNVGAQLAKAPVLLLHDNDMLVPADYLSRILQRLALGYAVVNPKRFIFYLSRQHSVALLAGTSTAVDHPPEAIVQNLEAGGSMAITRQAFEQIGGMDEGFVGWGGEDNELWDRCLTLPTWIWGYEPIVHLWHGPQPLKQRSDNPNLERYYQRLAIPTDQRISELKRLLGKKN